MKKLIFLLILFVIPFQTVFAEELVMYVDQSEYYFKVGENAVIPVDIENDYGRQISGIIQFTVTQKITQANTQFSSSNTQQSTFVLNEGDQKASLDFGTSDSPSTLIVNLNFIYNDGNQMNVFFDPITIYFVSDESQKNNIQNKMQSSSQQGSPSPNNSQNPQSSIQQRLDEIMKQPSQTQDPQQRLQNNQLPQDSTALKKEIQLQLQEENSLKEEFEKQLVSNEDFLKSHKQLLQQGYNATNANLNPSSASTGKFEVNYENEQGKWAKIQGTMVNGTLTELQKITQEEQDNLLSKLRNNPTFQEYENQLNQDRFVEQNLEFIFDGNMTSILLEYQNDEFQTATIVSEFENDELISINLEKPWKDYSYLYYLLILLPIGIFTYFLYKKLKIKKKLPSSAVILKEPKKFDYVLASNNMIKEAKNNFKEKQYKDAYQKINQAIRLFLSYELSLNKEITNEEILLHLDQTKYPVTEIENCFKLSSLVEFAKHEENKDKFFKMISMTENMIRRKYYDQEEKSSSKREF